MEEKNKNEIKKPEVPKKAKWTILGDVLTVTMPNGITADFDMSKVDSRAIKYYGLKQRLSDEVASVENVDEKLVGMKAWYKDAVASGLEITETGKIGIKGKIRTNAKVSVVNTIKANLELITDPKEKAKAIEVLRQLGMTI